MSEDEALDLFVFGTDKSGRLRRSADEVREHRVGNAVTYVRNQNINVTNLCINACGFCGFSKKPGDDGIYYHDSLRSRRRQRSQKNAKYQRSVPSVGFMRILMPDPIVTSTVGFMRLLLASTFMQAIRWKLRMLPKKVS